MSRTEPGGDAQRERNLFIVLSGCAAMLVCIIVSLVMFLVGVWRFGVDDPAADLDATLNAALTSVPMTVTFQVTELPNVTIQPTATSIPVLVSEPQGRIVFTCQIFREKLRDQVCIMNADGSGFRRLTTNNFAKHFYPSLSPDGKSVVFTSNTNDGFEIYELQIDSADQKQLTNKIGNPTAPEISPDGSQIVFTLGDDDSNTSVWLMNRDGSNPRPLYAGQGWDPTWSPDGQQVLFASLINNAVQLMVINRDGSGLRQITRLDFLRGRSDWAADGRHLVTYFGEAWKRELVLINADGSESKQITPPGGNSQGPSFSPDGQWVAFTAYFDLFGDVNGCEIYIMRIDGTRLTRLTNNNYCDWQPRWGQ